LGDWYGTALFWRPQLALLVNERTLPPVLVPLAPAVTLPERLGPVLAQVLKQYGIARAFIDHEVAEMSEVEVVKTRNRSVVGTMNEFCFEAAVYRERSGAADLLGLARRLAETPCSAIGYSTPARLLLEVVSGASH
jgi:hypothetical protein